MEGEEDHRHTQKYANRDTTVQPDAEPLETLFELNDTLYAKAHVAPTSEVYLWLGVRLLPPPSPPLYIPSVRPPVLCSTFEIDIAQTGKRDASLPHPGSGNAAGNQTRGGEIRPRELLRRPRFPA